MFPVVIGCCAAATTFIGGRFALHWKSRIHWLLGFGAGAVIGVAAFDLFPEALHLRGGAQHLPLTVGMVVLGFALCMALYKLVPSHTHDAETHGPVGTGAPRLASNSQATSPSTAQILGAGSLAIHSTLDGIGIGLALHVSLSVGIIVAIGVLVHDFSDGINTVAIILRNRGDESQALRWLVLDSFAPLAGVLSTYLFTLSQTVLGLTLALFCGLFLYIGAFDLLPEGYRRNTRLATTLLAALGASTVYAAVTLAKQ